MGTSMWLARKINPKRNKDIVVQELIELLNRKVYISNKWFRLSDAIEDIIDSYISFLNEENMNVLCIDFSKGIRNED